MLGEANCKCSFSSSLTFRLAGSNCLVSVGSRILDWFNRIVLTVIVGHGTSMSRGSLAHASCWGYSVEEEPFFCVLLVDFPESFWETWYRIHCTCGMVHSSYILRFTVAACSPKKAWLVFWETVMTSQSPFPGPGLAQVGGIVGAWETANCYSGCVPLEKAGLLYFRTLSAWHLSWILNFHKRTHCKSGLQFHSPSALAISLGTIVSIMFRVVTSLLWTPWLEATCKQLCWLLLLPLLILYVF